ncbi:hypothetical protein JOL62DRAFT_613899 [Phyllosticta paracitricarpa]|uniref:Uncharacterized protein n=1 Tax=Phyllosticta paracitricarpa TaxID=2016321 RepID=A0ABR1N178_9PEZI
MRLKMLPLLLFSFCRLVASASKVMIDGPAALKSADMQPSKPARSRQIDYNADDVVNVYDGLDLKAKDEWAASPDLVLSLMHYGMLAAVSRNTPRCYHRRERHRKLNRSQSSNERSSNPTDTTTTTYSKLNATAVRKLLEGGGCARAQKRIFSANDMFRPIVEPPALSPPLPPPPPPPPPHEEIRNSQTSSSLDNNKKKKKKKKKEEEEEEEEEKNTWRISKLGHRHLFKREDHKEFCDTDISSLLRMLACPPEKTHTPLDTLSCAPDRPPNCDEIPGPPKNKTRSGDTWDPY